MSKLSSSSPTPALNIRMPGELANVTQLLQKHWNDIPGDCAELRHRVVHDNETEQLYELALDAHRAATKDLSALQLELTELLEPPQVHNRQRRFVGYIAAAAIGAGLLNLGTQLTSGCIAGVLVPCEDDRQIETNRHDIAATVNRLRQSERQ